MKTVKIILVGIVAFAIVFFISKYIVKLFTPQDISPPNNQFVERIESKINSMENLPTSKFCSKYYTDILYDINAFYSKKLLGNNEDDNNLWKRILTKNLFAVYAPKFVQQSLYVFGHSDWLIKDLNFIRSEIRVLQSSPNLEKGSDVSNSLKDLLTILSKYDEITGFIYNCNNFSYSNYNMSDKFPMYIVSDKIQITRNYLKNNLDNKYVNNCSRLHTNLNNLPQNLFMKQVEYLHNKIKYYFGSFSKYSSQKDYSDSIYTPLLSEIKLLDNDIFGIDQSVYDRFSKQLTTELDDENLKAYVYYSQNNK
jgi:hypothetical protein